MPQLIFYGNFTLKELSNVTTLPPTTIQPDNNITTIHPTFSVTPTSTVTPMNAVVQTTPSAK